MEINNQNHEIIVYVEREGALAAIGHDLALEARGLSGTLNGSAIEITVVFDQLRVLGNVS